MEDTVKMNSKTENIKELLNNANQKLEKLNEIYTKTEREHKDILEKFGLESLIYKIPLELFAQNDIADFDYIHQTVVEKVNEESNKYFISQLEKNIGILQSLNSSLIKHQQSVNKILRKYKAEYKAKSEDVNQDLLNISSLQTSVHKLQAEIHQANEQQEQKKNIITKFQECSQMKRRIDKCKEEDKVLMKEMERYRMLPPDLGEAQKKLDHIKQKYRQISDEFTHMLQKSC